MDKTNAVANMRNSNIEMLRFLMMFGICMWHILMHGFGLRHMATNEMHPSYEQILALCFLVPATNCFMFISGYFGLKLKREKLISLFVQATFYYLLCIIIRDTCSFGLWIGLSYIIKNPFPLTNGAWWFLTWYIVIMIISPLVELNGGKKRDSLITSMMIFINSFGIWLNHRSSGSDLMGLLTIYMTGRMLSKYYRELEKITIKFWLFIFFLVTAVLTLAAAAFSSRGDDKMVWTLLMYNNPMVIIQAVSLFYFTKGLPMKLWSIPRFLGSHCFAIYLITEFTSNAFYILWRNVYESHGMIIMFALALGTCILICFIDRVRVVLSVNVNKVLLRMIYKIERRCEALVTDE